MDPDSIPIFAIALVVLILLSAFFSASETAYSSLNKARLKTQLESGKATVRRAYALSENYDRLLFTILVGNNIVNITATTVSTLLFALLIRNESVSATVSTAVMTVLVLLFGEITPKTIAKEMPERFACAVSYPLSFFIFILYPLTLIFTGWKALLRKVFRFRNDDVITEEELLTYVEEAGEDGTLDESETDLISSAIEFNESEVGDILVPRVNVIAVNIDSPMEDIQRAFLEHGFSRLPVYKGSVDSIVGMIHEKDFYAALMKGAGDIRGIVTSVALATEHMRISVLLRSMQRQKVHLAVVVDEYGGTLGIVTLEDILEELVGEIWDEHDEVVDYFNKLDDKTYLVDGNAELTDFFELFSLKEDEEIESNTVSGWVIEKCGDIPPIGYTFDYKQLKIEVTKRNLKKVLEIKVSVIEEEKEETED